MGRLGTLWRRDRNRVGIGPLERVNVFLTLDHVDDLDVVGDAIAAVQAGVVSLSPVCTNFFLPLASRLAMRCTMRPPG